MLCNPCASLPTTWLVPRFHDLRTSIYPAHTQPIHFWTYDSWSALLASVETCELCSLIVKEARTEPTGPYQKTERKGIRFQAYGSERLEVWCVEEGRVARLRVGVAEGLSPFPILDSVGWE